MFRAFFALLICLVGLAAHAAPAVRPVDGWVVDQWTSENGLPTDHAMDVARTPDGTIWVASTSGLLRFDGTMFELVDVRDLPGLRTSRLVALAVHPHDGALWMMSDHGQGIARLHNGQLTNWNRDQGFQPNGTCLREGRDTIWFCTGEGLYSLTDQPLRVPQSPRKTVSDVLEAPDGTLWVATHAEVTRIAPDGSATTLDERVGVPDFVGRLGITSSSRVFLIQSLTGPLWTWDGAAFSPAPGDVRAAGWTVLSEETIPVAGPSSTWGLSTKGVYTDETLVLPFDGRITSAIATPDDSLWLTTHSAGVLRIRRSPLRIVRAGDTDAQVSSVMVDRSGRLWLKGVDAWWTPGPEGPETLDVQGDGPGGMLYVHGDRLRFAGSGIMEVSETAEGNRSLIPLSDTLSDHVQATEVISETESWIGGRSGLWHEVNGTPTKIQYNGEDISEIRDLLYLPDGGLLIASGGRGLRRMDTLGRIVRLDNTQSIPTDNPRHIRLHGDNIWLSTEDAGLCTAPLRGNGTHWRCIGSNHGLPARGVHASVDDGRGRTWMSTNRGIVVARTEQLDDFARGDTETVDLLVLDTRDGMPNAECNGGNDQAFAQGLDGWLWFATQQGAVGVNPALFAWPDAPPLRLGPITVDGQKLDPSNVNIPPESPTLRLHWSTQDSVWGDRVRFQTKLGDSDWSPPQREREAVFTHLPPGQNRISVRAGIGGSWGEAIHTEIYRRPQIHEHTLFPFLLLVIGGCTTMGIAWLRGNTQRKRQLELENQVALRTEELTETTRLLATQKDQLTMQANRLAQLDDLRTRMIVNMHHELRTPVALILGPLEQVLHDHRLTPESLRNIQMATRNAKQLEKLIEQLFDLTRLEAGELPVRARRIDLGALARKVVADHSFSAEQRNITLIGPSAQVPIWVDPDLIEKAVSNLVSNALKFTPAGGCVAVSLNATETVVRISVEDDGPGISEADRPRIFERLYQVDRSDRRAHGGAGLGLALAQEMVELHGGAIGVEPRTTGGSTFWIDLSLDELPHNVEEVDLNTNDDLTVPPLHNAEVNANGKRVILVVEDHPDMREFLAAQFRPSARVLTAADGEDALQQLQSQRPDVVVSDVMMPKMTGIELATAMRDNPALADIPIVLLSAKTSIGDRLAGLRVADDYMTKPFHSAELRTRVLRLARRTETEAADIQHAPPPNDADTTLLQRLVDLADQHMSDSNFRVAELARAAGMSERTLRRELHRIAGEAPNEWLRTRRLEKAHVLLHERKYRTVGEVAAAVGLSRTYFARAYQAWAGHTPSSVLSTVSEDGLS